MRKMLRTLCVVTVLVIALDHAVAESQVDLHLKISHLESQLKMLMQRAQQHEELFKQCRDQEERLSSLQRHVDTALENKSHEIRDVIEKVQRWNRDAIMTPYRRFARSSDPTEVAFTAMLNHELNDVPIHTTIIFDFLIHHTGTTYDDSTGVFTCLASIYSLFLLNLIPLTPRLPLT